jgi:lipopolysaccharide export system protein LptC
MVANRAVQRSSDTPLVDIRGMHARLSQPQGPLMIAANQGRYNIDTHRVAIDGPVKVAGSDGFQLSTSDVLVDLDDRQLASEGPAQGTMRLGQFQAGHIKADLNDKVVVLDGGARLKITQGAVR